MSNDGGATWTSIVKGVLPQSHPAGPNFAYLLKPMPSLAEPDIFAPAQKVKVRILSGYRADAWGLGEIEIFGTGALLGTDDEYNRVNADITDLVAGQTVHYRLVAVSNGKTVAGKDLTYTVPSSTKPYAVTGAASRFVAGGAHLEARINTLGRESVVRFEYGPSTAYGMTTMAKRAGPEITIRTVFDNLTGLTPGSTIHYRVVVQGDGGTTQGDDATFVAK